MPLLNRFLHSITICFIAVCPLHRKEALGLSQRLSSLQSSSASCRPLNQAAGLLANRAKLMDGVAANSVAFDLFESNVKSLQRIVKEMGWKDKDE